MIVEIEVMLVVLLILLAHKLRNAAISFASLQKHPTSKKGLSRNNTVARAWFETLLDVAV